MNVDARWKGEPLQEASHFIDLHVDGAFTDFPATWHTAVQSAQVMPQLLLQRMRFKVTLSMVTRPRAGPEGALF